MLILMITPTDLKINVGLAPAELGGSTLIMAVAESEHDSMRPATAYLKVTTDGLLTLTCPTLSSSSTSK